MRGDSLIAAEQDYWEAKFMMRYTETDEFMMREV